ncbi:hypothetical protein ACTXT7_003711 [Hymenolepis weldensis]
MSEDPMADTTVNNGMKRHAVMVSKKAKRSHFETARFLKVGTSFVCKVRKELVNEKNGDELATTRKRKQGHCLLSTDSLRIPEFVRRVHDMMDMKIVGCQCAKSCQRASSV